MSKPIASTARTSEILKTYGLHAKKGYGQNFLVDVSVVSRCADMCHGEGAVIEIGPGIGSLTEQLAMVSKHVRSYEVDERLLPVLEDTLSEYDNVEILLQDFLECDIDSSVKELKEKYGSVSVCANLPYYITTPVLFKLFECKEDIEWITVMVQKEVADRFSAEVNSKTYGALSVESQFMYDVKRLFVVPARCFNPAPRVDSAIIQFHTIENREKLENEEEYFDFIKACFVQRRKTLYNNLKPICSSKEQIEEILERANLKSSVRAQELNREQFIELYKIWKDVVM